MLSKDEQTMHTIESHLEALQAEYDRLLEENIQLKTKNAKLMQFKKANTPMYKGEYNDA